MIARMTALSVASKEGLRQITKIDFDQETKSFFVYGTMFDLDPDTYENGRAPMFVRVTNGKIDLVDGI
ncbi:MAG: hypothetical protein ACPGTS_01025 [Minisyncoccia bacterium]